MLKISAQSEQLLALVVKGLRVTFTWQRKQNCWVNLYSGGKTGNDDFPPRCMCHSATGRNEDFTTLFRNWKKPGASSLHRDLPGVGSMIATHMKHWAKPLVSFLPTPWFLPMNRLRLLALRQYEYSESFHGENKSQLCWEVELILLSHWLSRLDFWT